MIKNGPILMMENDPIFGRSLQVLLQNENALVLCVESLEETLDAFFQCECSLVILNLQQLDVSHIKAVCTMRTAKTVPILAITNTVSPMQKVELFHAGIHAHIEKPTDADICIAQAKALIQLYGAEIVHKRQGEITFGTELIIQPSFRRSFVLGKPLELTRKEFDLLYFLAQYPYQVFSYEQLYFHVWKDDYIPGGENTVKVHIVSLRKKLTSIKNNCIQNVWGIGYKFVPPDKDSQK